MTARVDNPLPISADEARLHAALVRLLGRRGDDAMRCLRKRQGLGPDEVATDAQVQAMTDQTTAALSLTGPWWRRVEPRFLDHNGWRTRGELIVWLQHLRMACGEAPEVFASAPRRPGDPLWIRTSRWLAAQLDRLLYEEGIPRRCHTLVKARVRQQICDRYDVPGMRHLPASICEREAISLLLRCELHGAHQVLELDDIKRHLEDPFMNTPNHS